MLLGFTRNIYNIYTLLAAGFTKKQRNEKNEKTKVAQKKWRKQRKAGKVQQAIDGGGVQLGTSERPGRCQPSPLRKKI